MTKGVVIPEHIHTNSAATKRTYISKSTLITTNTGNTLWYIKQQLVQLIEVGLERIALHSVVLQKERRKHTHGTSQRLAGLWLRYRVHSIR